MRRTRSCPSHLSLERFGLMRVLETYQETISDGIGVRYAIYFAGCRHRCVGCHNPESWRADRGRVLDAVYIDEIVTQIQANPLLDGITLSGGDPFYDPAELLAFLEILKKQTNLNIWCYTGYTYEQLQADPTMRACLAKINVLVDGRYEQALTDPTLYFRGSKNQRLLLLQDGKIVKELQFEQREGKKYR